LEGRRKVAVDHYPPVRRRGAGDKRGSEMEVFLKEQAETLLGWE